LAFIPGHNYTGPVIEIGKRIDRNENPLPVFEPYNKIDNIALHHDFCYKTAYETGTNTRKDCDKAMLDDLNAVKLRELETK